MKIIERKITSTDEKLPITIIPIGNIHAGATNQDRKLFLKIIKDAQTTPNTHLLQIEPRMPINFEDCVRTLRLNNCAMCSYKPQRGINWKTCMQRVRMFRAEGGAYPGV